MLFLSTKHGGFSERGRILLTLLLVLLISLFFPVRAKTTSSGERIIVCLIRLEHADAEHLTAVLKPFLSPQGSIVADVPTNTLIIKDRASIVNMLAEVIKGKPCAAASEQPDVEAGRQQEEN